MKFFHLSDLHIGLKLYHRDLLQDQAFVLRQIVELAAAEQPDAVVIAGDIYDRAVPSAEAVAVFDQFLLELTQALPKAQIMAISGNHDSGPRINCYRGILEHQRVHMIGLPPQQEEEYIARVVLEDAYGPVNFLLLPFVRPSMVRRVFAVERSGEETEESDVELRSEDDAMGNAPDRALTYEETLERLIAREEVNTQERNVLVSHQFYLPEGASAEAAERMDSEIRTVGNIDAVSARVLRPFDYAALGHIHKPMQVGCDRYRYCGSPMQYSVSEAGQQKGILAVELRGKGTVSTRVLPLTPRHEVRLLRGTLEELVQGACDDYVSVIVTDPEDLDVPDMQERLRGAYPNLLEIRRQTIRQADYTQAGAPSTPEMDPFELCCSFLGNPGEEEQMLLRDIIRSVQETEAET